MSPAMFEEYALVLADHQGLLVLIRERFEVCYPLVELDRVQHEPDNRFVECAQASVADYLITVNTARGHFDQPAYGGTRVITPGAFIHVPEVKPQVLRLQTGAG
jgi:predicted nucleic acid-binding protein